MAKINYGEFLNILKVTPPEVAIGIYGFHGCGKTQCAAQAGRELGYEQIAVLDMGIVGDAGDILGNPLTMTRTKTRVKLDVDGQPVREKDVVSKGKAVPGEYVTETYESAYTEYAEPYWWAQDETKPTFLIVDEANRFSNRSVQNGMMRLINEQKVGNRRLHPESRIVGTFNPTGLDHYHVQEWDIAYRSRFVTYEFCPTKDEWLAEGEKRGYHPEVMRYIANYPGELLPWESEEEMNSIKENSQTKNGRAWEKVSKIMCSPYFSDTYGKKFAKFKNVVAGVVGYQGAEKFVQYLSAQNRIDIKDLLGNFGSHKKNVDGMKNFDQAMLVRDVVEYLKSIRENPKEIQMCKGGLLDFFSTVKAENATVGYQILYNGIVGSNKWSATIYKAIPELMAIRSDHHHI